MLEPPALRFTHHEYHQFYAWCKASVSEMTAAKAALETYGPDYEDRDLPRRAWKEVFALEEQVEKNSVLAPVLAVMAAEQLIVTYAMQRLSHEMISTLTYIDRLDTVAKWEAFPLMTCGKHLGADSEALRELRIQVRQRNAFSHPKPLIVSIGSDEHMKRVEDKIDGNAKQRFSIACAAPRTVDLLAKELMALDKHRSTRRACKMAGVVPVRRSGA